MRQVYLNNAVSDITAAQESIRTLFNELAIEDLNYDSLPALRQAYIKLQAIECELLILKEKGIK